MRIDRPQMYYYCADSHFYQEGIVTISNPVDETKEITIHQYIVGTGGTPLDKLCKEIKEINISRSPLMYRVNTDKQGEKFGFLMFNCSNNESRFIENSESETQQFGGKRFKVNFRL